VMYCVLATLRTVSCIWTDARGSFLGWRTERGTSSCMGGLSKTPEGHGGRMRSATKTGSTHRGLIGEQLDAININEDAERRPLLSVLCISKTNRVPSAGFWECASRLPRYDTAIDRERFLTEETEAVFDTWAP
jgi:hypothetical protein